MKNRYGAWGMEMREQRSFRFLFCPSAFFHAQCPMPHAQCPITND
ncbi:hypothetical protein [Nostoc linckia]|nr:hypothetical protein [Nostoc linckia]